MNIKQAVACGVRGLAATAAVGVAAYAAYVGNAWLRYGDSPSSTKGEADPLLDLFMPKYDVAERTTSKWLLR